MGKFSDTYNDHRQMQSNVDKNKAAVGRTSKVKECCNSTSNCQYDRLHKTGKMETGPA